MVLVGRWLLLLAGVLAKQHQYCIIGAGPAGLQLGHFLFHAQRDYVIFERAAAAGSFFEQYPRHRRLISLNKRTVREGRTKDFAFRHDWNSLIDLKEESARTTPVTARSKELFPHASVLVDYLRDFALEQKDHIRYSTEVLKVRRTEDGFELKLVIGDAVCRELILATGFHRPRPADAKVDGSHLLLGYEALPASGEAFQGQAVLVLGQGNAALETAQELQHYTSEVHLLSRARTLPEGGHGVRFAYQTHYVGDIRAGRTTILDTYLLKSLDTFDFDALNGQHRLVILPCGGRLCLWSVQADDCLDRNCSKQHALGGQNLSYKLPVGTAAKDSDLHRRMKELSDRYPAETELEEVESSFWEGPNEQLSSDQLDAMGLDPEVFNVSYVELSLSSRVLRSNPKLAAEVAELRTVAGGHDHLRFPMDAVIRCFGWIFDSELLDPKTVPVNVTHHGKYPKITPAWEIKGVPGLYVAGTISHSLDFRKSAGGFIHGFRYTSRALFRSLEERNFGVAWPQQEWSIPLTCTPGTAAATCAAGAGASASAGWAAVADRLLERINAASGPYQMFEFLGDMLLFEPNGTELSLRLLEEVPLLHFHERYQDTARLTWSFRYHDHFHGPDVLSPFRVGATRVEEAHNSKFLHPHLAFFPAKSATPRLRHWMLEDVFTQWTGPDDRRPLLRFLTRAAAFLFAAT